MRKKVLISVAMGVKYPDKNIDLLKRSVDSVLAQSLKNFELIICERDSSQQARDYLHQAAMTDPRIRLIDGHGTNHLGGQLNRCIDVSTGDYIARMDADDYSYPERFEKQSEYLSENRSAAFVGCSVRLVCEGKYAGIRRLPKRPTIDDFMFVQPFVHPTLMFRRKALIVAGGYSDSPERLGCEDYDLLMRLYAHGLYGENSEIVYLDYTIPPARSKHRSFGMRINETRTRFDLYSKMGLMPKSVFFAIKPVAAGFIPQKLLSRIKTLVYKRSE